MWYLVIWTEAPAPSGPSIMRDDAEASVSRRRDYYSAQINSDPARPCSTSQPSFVAVSHQDCGKQPWRRPSLLNLLLPHLVGTEQSCGATSQDATSRRTRTHNTDGASLSAGVNKEDSQVCCKQCQTRRIEQNLKTEISLLFQNYSLFSISPSQ